MVSKRRQIDSIPHLAVTHVQDDALWAGHFQGLGSVHPDPLDGCPPPGTALGLPWGLLYTHKFRV